MSILAKYGGEEYLQKAPKELLQGQTEEYVEFSRTGQVIKGKERAMVRSKYPEDGEYSIFNIFLICTFISGAELLSMYTDKSLLLSVFINNHTAVWGSYYDVSAGQWGFACCHSLVHLSYCTGEAGIEASMASSAKNLLAGGSSSASASTSAAAPSSSLHQNTNGEPSSSQQTQTQTQPESSEDRKRKAEALFSKRRLGEGEVKIDESRLADAIREERERKRKGKGLDDDLDDERGGRGGKRMKGDRGDKGDKDTKGGKGKGGYEVTEEELEAYRMNRRMVEDPMANYVDEEDV